MKTAYSISTGAAVALSAATAKTVLFVLGTASFGVDLTGIEISFDGVTASAVPVLVEVCRSTAATNSTPGTANTTATVVQTAGRTITAGFTGGYNCTSEPTVLTPIDRLTLTPNGGVLIYDWPRDATLDCDVSNGFAIRCTAPAVVNVNCTLKLGRC
jgi:hypothetical protein